jgi:hypothetical protein
METKELKPNQSGTFSNRVNFGNEDGILFVVEFNTQDMEERQRIVRLIAAQNDLLEALQVAVKAYKDKGWNNKYPPLKQAEKAISKALTK